MSRYFFKYTILLFLVLTVMPPCSNAQSAREIIARYLDTVSNGDEQKWKRLNSFYAESIEYYGGEGLHLTSQSTDRFTSYRKLYRRWPDKTKEELYSDSAFTKLASEFLFTSKQHYIRIGQIPLIVSEPKKHLWFEFFPTQLQRYMANSNQLIYHGTIELQNETFLCHEIEVVTKELTRRLYFNTDTFLLEAIFVPEGNYFTRLLNYKNIEGYLLPTSERSLQNGDLIAFREYTKVLFNQDLPAKIFDEPKH